MSDCDSLWSVSFQFYIRTLLLNVFKKSVVIGVYGDFGRDVARISQFRYFPNRYGFQGKNNLHDRVLDTIHESSYLFNCFGCLFVFINILSSTSCAIHVLCDIISDV